VRRATLIRLQDRMRRVLERLRAGGVSRRHAASRKARRSLFCPDGRLADARG